MHFIPSQSSHEVSVGQQLADKLKYKLCINNGCIWQ